MATNYVSFKVLEVTGETKEEALSKAPFDIMGDATQAFKSWKKKQGGAITEADKKQFMIEYLTKKTKNIPGVGFCITVESAVADTRERPYKIEKVKNEKGTRKFNRVFRIVDPKTNRILKEVNTNQADVFNAYKELVTSGEYKADADIIVERTCVSGNEVIAHCHYTPAKSTRFGSYICFGIEKN